jgi:hypothetical protein
MTLDQKKEFIIEFETEWLLNEASLKDCAYIIKHGWEGWDNMSIEAIESKYKDLTQD